MKTMQEKEVIRAAVAAVDEMKKTFGASMLEIEWLTDATRNLVKAVEALEKTR